VESASHFRAHRLPVVAIVRDIRDALVRPLPPWHDEAALNESYRLVWEHRDLASTWIRYEALAREPEATLDQVAEALHYDGAMHITWDAEGVPAAMVKLADRHALLRSGGIVTSRVGVGRNSGRRFSAETLETAQMMGYPA
jgi:hypothetical protein